MPANNYKYSPTQHLRLKVNGSEVKRGFFDWLMGEMDSDWPFAPPAKRRPGVLAPAECGKCHGTEWRNPALLIDEVRRGALQIHMTHLLPGNLKVKIKHHAPASGCEELRGICGI